MRQIGCYDPISYVISDFKIPGVSSNQFFKYRIMIFKYDGYVRPAVKAEKGQNNARSSCNIIDNSVDCRTTRFYRNCRSRGRYCENLIPSFSGTVRCLAHFRTTLSRLVLIPSLGNPRGLDQGPVPQGLIGTISLIPK
jgi:hypothetical protein